MSDGGEANCMEFSKAEDDGVEVCAAACAVEEWLWQLAGSLSCRSDLPRAGGRGRFGSVVTFLSSVFDVSS